MKTTGEILLRKEGNRQGFSLLIYMVILNVVVMLLILMAAIVPLITVMTDLLQDRQMTPEILMEALTVEYTRIIQQVTEVFSGWGYLLAVAIGAVLMFVIKKPAFFARILQRRGRNMKMGRFFVILTFFMSAQMLYQLMAYGLDLLLRHWGISLADFLQDNSVSTDTLGMFLYVCLVAPIFEELVFRGMVLHGLLPFGRRFAVVMSAVFFGLFHGSPLQSAYAILVGLVLGYVAVEYHVIWAMILHMINNLIMADTLPRLLELLPHDLGNFVMEIILLAFFVAALVILVVKRRSLIALWKRDRVRAWQRKAYLLSPGMLLLCLGCFAEMGLFILLLLQT